MESRKCQCRRADDHPLWIRIGLLMDEHTRSDIEHHGFRKSIALVTAVSDLLAAASAESGATTRLDDSTLLTLAQTVYQEALVLESMYIQMQDIYQQSRVDNRAIYDTYPQVMVPLNILSVEQLAGLRAKALEKRETLTAFADGAEAPSQTPTLHELTAIIKHIEQELTNR